MLGLELRQTRNEPTPCQIGHATCSMYASLFSKISKVSNATRCTHRIWRATPLTRLPALWVKVMSLYIAFSLSLGVHPFVRHPILRLERGRGGCVRCREVMHDVHVLDLVTLTWREVTHCIAGNLALLRRVAHQAVQHPADPHTILIYGGYSPANQQDDAAGGFVSAPAALNTRRRAGCCTKTGLLRSGDGCYVVRGCC